MVAIAGSVGALIQDNLAAASGGKHHSRADRFDLHRAAKPLSACRPGALGLRRRRPRRRTEGGGHDRRARSRATRRSRRVPGRDRILRREFFRRGGGAGVLAGAAGAARIDRLQGHQHRRLHDRASYRTLCVVWLGRGAARRSRQSGSGAIVGLVAGGRGADCRRIGRQIVAAWSDAMPPNIARRMPAGRKARWPARWGWRWPDRAATPNTWSKIPFSMPRRPARPCLTISVARSIFTPRRASSRRLVYAALALVV